MVHRTGVVFITSSARHADRVLPLLQLSGISLTTSGEVQRRFMGTSPREGRDEGGCQPEIPVKDHQGLAIFALFFLLSLLEAVQGRHWITAGVWLAVGIFFVMMDRPRHTH